MDLVSPENSKKILQDLLSTIGHSSARNVGDIHRLLTRCIDDENTLDRLSKRLLTMNFDALKCVCADLGILPVDVQQTKLNLCSQLLDWVSGWLLYSCELKMLNDDSREGPCLCRHWNGTHSIVKISSAASET